MNEHLISYLIGAAGDGTGGIVAELVLHLLKAAGQRVRERFSGPEPLQALRQALTRALQVALDETWSLWSADPEQLRARQKLLQGWLQNPGVLRELRQLLDPREEGELDVEYLKGQMEATGLHPDGLEPRPFTVWIHRLASAFQDAASQEPALQGRLNINLLRRMVVRLEELGQVAKDQVAATKEASQHLERLVTLQRLGVEEMAQAGEKLGKISDSVETIRKLLLDAKGQGPAAQQRAYLLGVTIVSRQADLEAGEQVPSELVPIITLLEQIRTQLLAAGPSSEELDEMERSYRDPDLPVRFGALSVLALFGRQYPNLQEQVMQVIDEHARVSTIGDNSAVALALRLFSMTVSLQLLPAHAALRFVALLGHESSWIRDSTVTMLGPHAAIPSSYGPDDSEVRQPLDSACSWNYMLNFRSSANPFELGV